MPAYLVYTFRDPALLCRLAQRLAPSPVVVHVDAKVDIGPFVAACSGQPHVVFVGDASRHVVSWAGISQVDAIMAMIDRALPLVGPDDHLVLLSGSCYPIVSAAEFGRHLSRAPRPQQIRFFDVEASDDHYRRQIRLSHYRDLAWLRRRTTLPAARKVRNTTIRLLEDTIGQLRKQKPPDGLRIMHGPTQWALTGACVAQVRSRWTPELRAYFARTWCPEEKVFHTLVADSPFASGTPFGGPEPYVGSHTLVHTYSSFHLIDPSQVRVFVLDDLDEVRGSGQFFVRKVHSVASAGLLDALDDGAGA